MRERSTPETDTETMRDEYDHVDTDFGPFAPSDTVPADFARCLERERDEAREALSLANKSLQYCERVIDRLENSNFSLSSALKAINGNPTN